MTTGEVIAAAVPTGALIGWLAKHFHAHKNGNGNGNGIGSKLDRIGDLLEAVKENTKGIPVAINRIEHIERKVEEK